MKLHRLAASVAVLTLVLAGCDSTAEVSSDLKTPAQKASYGIGLSMGKNLSQEGMDDLDSQAVALGIEDALAKKDQRLSDEELMEAFSFLQARAQERMSALNDATAKAGAAFLVENAKRDGVTTTESGLQYEVIEKAEGAQPKVTDVVSVHYQGTLVDGSVFDSSIERGEPVEFPVGGVIPGWVEGLQLMSVGEKFKFYIPSELAYGAQSPTPAIPANSTLVFEVELLDIVGLPATDTADLEASEPAEEIEE
ncbi:FKBP-type peptidyl-prolyl cis-trans isomerase [Pseudomonas sp. C27(2019)]|uniref:FKBP-type peptidyl-prolyl cis-trans isomerase n=1 Tax=Pseudomonas sp. C27(2019) TaxID=2604941 RepID=UPI001248CA7D|nr:FKBP-type peptidyl-prolyl cis-trans isomerase [Pseudomonas sp. C27(2019)]QEY59270.1 FKBP-type peptidyl-prolyl cis-trans isomerase [Pseudomonas sp. C27(2019)]